MSKYSKSQEYRLAKHLEKIQGVEIIKYYGNREKNRGDFLVKVGTKQVRIEHKSTENQKAITLHKDWMLKAIGACLRLQGEEGVSIPLVTFSLKYCPQIYTWSVCNFGGRVGLTGMLGVTRTMRLEDLEIYGGHFIQLEIGEINTYIHRLEYWMEAIQG